MITTLEVGSVIVPTKTILEFDQSYEDLGAVDFRRLANGDGVSRVAWTGKISTSINGKGWAPSAFENLSVGSTYTIKCAIPRSASDSTTSVVLPSSRRSDTDHEPIGFAIVGDDMVSTSITNLAAILAASTDTATLTTVSGATGYRVHYWPQIDAIVQRNTCTGRSDANYEWQIEAEEV